MASNIKQGVSALLRAVDVQQADPQQYLDADGKKKSRPKPETASQQGAGLQMFLLHSADRDATDRDEENLDISVGREWIEIQPNEFRWLTPDKKLELRVGLSAEKSPNWWGVMEANGRSVRVMEQRYCGLGELQARAQHWWAWDWDGEQIINHQDREQIRYHLERLLMKREFLDFLAETDWDALLSSGAESIAQYRVERKNRDANSH